MRITFLKHQAFAGLLSVEATAPSIIIYLVSGPFLVISNCDASENAYAAELYHQATDDEGNSNCPDYFKDTGSLVLD
jgi:hypothetical protein